jgi:SWI/SNF-related matrix-associated actin-dependent regulator 1 of chromatin subfamily A
MATVEDIKRTMTHNSNSSSNANLNGGASSSLSLHNTDGSAVSASTGECKGGSSRNPISLSPRNGNSDTDAERNGGQMTPFPKGSGGDPICTSIDKECGAQSLSMSTAASRSNENSSSVLSKNQVLSDENIHKSVAYGKRESLIGSRTSILFSLLSLEEFTMRAEGEPAHPEIISMIAKKDGVRLNRSLRRFHVPLSEHDSLASALSSLGVLVDPLPRSVIVSAQLQRSQTATSSSSSNGSPGSTWAKAKIFQDLRSTPIPARLLKGLAGFQREGIEFVLRNEGRALIADEMGLGKTVQAIGCCAAYRADWPVLIIAPSSARMNWQSELLHWLCPDLVCPSDIALVESTNNSLRGKHKIVIISYSLVDKLYEKLRDRKFGVIVADESHYLKNGRANRTKALVPLIQTARRAILLSGTPALSRPRELFTQLAALKKDVWSDERAFMQRYCRSSNSDSAGGPSGIGVAPSSTDRIASSSGSMHVTSTGASMEYNGASNTAELHTLLKSTVMIRRLKKDILHMLPRKKRIVEEVDVHDPILREQLAKLLVEIESVASSRQNQSMANYERATRNSIGRAVETTTPAVTSASDGQVNRGTHLPETDTRQQKALIMKLFTDSAPAKLPAILEKIGTFLDDRLSGKLLIFAHHQCVMEGLSKFLAKRGIESIRIDGQTAVKDRFAKVAHFQKAPTCRVALLAITAAGVAITLTAASTVFFAELYWTPGSMIQAEDRAHRIGQTSTVSIHYFLGKGTVDELLWPMVQNKMRLLGEVVEGTAESDMLRESAARRVAGSEQPSEEAGKSSLVSLLEEVAGAQAAAALAAKAAAAEANATKNRKRGRNGALSDDEECDVDTTQDANASVSMTTTDDGLASVWLTMANGAERECVTAVDMSEIVESKGAD